MGNKKKQTNEFDNYFDDDFEVVYEDLDDLGSYLSEDSSDNNDDYDDYDGYDGDTDYYDDDDYDDDDGDDYDDDYYDDDYNNNGRDSKKKKRNDKQDPDSKKSKKKKRRGLPNVGKPVTNIAKTGINATKKLVGTILRAATLILIALIILTLLKAFLSNTGSYGKILLLGQTKDTILIAYLAVGAVLVGYELLNFFWAASRTRARSRHNNRLDTGRRAFVLCYHLRRFLSSRHVQSPDSKFSKLAYRCTRRTVYLRWSESHTTAAVHCRCSKLCGQENYSEIRFKTVSFINFLKLILIYDI